MTRFSRTSACQLQVIDFASAMRSLNWPPKPIAEVNAASTPAHETTTASAERRQLTVMFCDLAALSARLDPEDLPGIISAYHHCCTELVERNGGFVAKYIGDGVLAYFGYPHNQVHEHDAERAVRTGLALVEVVPKLTTNVGSSLQVRVGIATGLVVVGDLICRDVAHASCAATWKSPHSRDTIAFPGPPLLRPNDPHGMPPLGR